MTDLEMLIATYKQFGIEIITYKDKENICIDLNDFFSKNPTYSDKIEGNACCTLEFTKDGKFIKQEFSGYYQDITNN